MAISFLRSFQVIHGTLSDAVPDGEEELYVSPEELHALYGCAYDMPSIRAAMSIVNAHCNRSTLWPAEIDSGDLELPPDRLETRLPVTPVIQITDLAGRFGFSRRDRQGWNMWQGNVAAYLVMLGGAPQWSPIDINQTYLEPATGVLSIQPSWMLAPYTTIRAKFIAGFLTIPERVKLALFEIISNMHAKGVSDRTRYSIGRVTRTYASDSFVTKTASSLLSPYVVQSLY